MRLLYVSDHRFHDINGQYYSETQFPAMFWERYLSSFDTIRVVGRRHDDLCVSNEGLIRSSRDETSFVLVNVHLTPGAFIRQRSQLIADLSRALDGVDAVVLKSPGMLGQYVARMAAQRNIPYAIEMVGCPFDALFNHGSLIHRLAAFPAYWSTRRQVRKAPAISYVTKEFLQSRYPSNASNRLAVSDVEITSSCEAVLEMRLDKIKKKSVGEVRIGLIGGLMTNAKGHTQALKVIARLAAMDIDAHLECVGAGNSAAYEALARRLGIERRVTFKGILPGYQAICEWLDGLDLYIQPSLQEGLPRALVEAMSRACPSVANRVGGIPELLPSKYISPPKQTVEMAETIARISVNKCEMAEMARANFTKSLEYSPEALDPIRIGFLADLANRASGNSNEKRTSNGKAT